MKFGLKPGLVKRRKMIKGRSLKVMAWGMVLSVFLSTPAFALTSAFSSRYEIGENTVYYAVDGENSSGLQKVNYVEYQPNSGVSPIIAYGNNLYGRSTITRITELLESQGKEVIAGINADFFDLTTGIPIGIVVQDGVFISSNTGQYAVGFKADGSAVIGKPVASMTLSSDAGNMVVDCFNKARSTYTTCMFDRNFSDTTKVSTEGTSIIFERLDDEEVRLNSSIRLRVVSKQTGSTPISIGENQMVLSVSAKGPLERIPNIAVGDEVTFSVTTTDSDWQDVVYAVGGKSLIENGTVDTTGSPTGLNPRSAVGVKADGTVVLYEVDGRQSGFSVGMSPSSLAQELLNLGCVDAINLDGGGSSAMVIQYPGETDAEVINSPSDGSLRTCANYIFLVNNGSKTGNVAHLHIYPETQYALPGASVPLTIKATDEHYYPVTAPSDVTYQVSDNNGSFSGNAYIAGDTKGGVTITAKSGSATGSQHIYIISAVDGLSITKDGSSTALSSLSVQGGSSTTLAVKGTYKGNAVAVGNTSVQWSVSGNIGTVKDGVFTASNQGGSGKLTVSYNGYTKTIPVTVSTTIGEAAQTQLLADFESELDFRMTTDGNIALATDYDSVYRGKGLSLIHISMGLFKMPLPACKNRVLFSVWMGKIPFCHSPVS